MALNKKAMDGVKPSMALSFKTVSHRFNPAPPYEKLREWTISQHFFLFLTSEPAICQEKISFAIVNKNSKEML